MESSTSPQAVIQAHSLAKQVTTGAGELQVLNNITLSIHAGESIAIVGKSGSGKSTLLGLLAGLDNPSAGQVILGAQDISVMSEDERAAVRNQYVGFVFQAFQLLPSLTALENVMLPLELKGGDNIEEQAQKWLGKVGLADRLDHRPSQLSGGEQQRVAIARAFVTEPDILFADEPTGNLDSATGKDIIDLLFALNTANQTTLVLVTHDAVLAQRCERSIELEAGAIVAVNHKVQTL